MPSSVNGRLKKRPKVNRGRGDPLEKAGGMASLYNTGCGHVWRLQWSSLAVVVVYADVPSDGE